MGKAHLLLLFLVNRTLDFLLHSVHKDSLLLGLDYGRGRSDLPYRDFREVRW